MYTQYSRQEYVVTYSIKHPLEVRECIKGVHRSYLYDEESSGQQQVQDEQYSEYLVLLAPRVLITKIRNIKSHLQL